MRLSFWIDVFNIFSVTPLKISKIIVMSLNWLFLYTLNYLLLILTTFFALFSWSMTSKTREVHIIWKPIFSPSPVRHSNDNDITTFFLYYINFFNIIMSLFQ